MVNYEFKLINFVEVFFYIRILFFNVFNLVNIFFFRFVEIFFVFFLVMRDLWVGSKGR